MVLLAILLGSMFFTRCFIVAIILILFFTNLWSSYLSINGDIEHFLPLQLTCIARTTTTIIGKSQLNLYFIQMRIWKSRRNYLISATVL